MCVWVWVWVWVWVRVRVRVWVWCLCVGRIWRLINYSILPPRSTYLFFKVCARSLKETVIIVIDSSLALAESNPDSF